MKAIVALLEDEHDDVVELAKTVIRTLDGLRAERQTYCVVVREGSSYQVFGPYETRNAARKDIGTHILASREGARGDVFWLRNGSGEADLDEG